MEELASLLAQSPEMKQINLEFSELESLEPLLPLLSRFPELRELLLFGNRLSSLPRDLSCLKSLEKLDISNNIIDEIPQILPGLCSLPRLKELHISVNTSNDEKTLINALKSLKNLNGIDIVNEDLPIISEYETESYKAEFEAGVEISTKPEEDIERTLVACENSGYFGDESALSQEYLEKVAVIYDDIREAWQQEDKRRDKTLAKDFEAGLKSVIESLAEKMQAGLQEAQLSAYTLKAKYDLAIICSEKLNELISLKNKVLGELLAKVNSVLEGLVREMIPLLPLNPSAQPLKASRTESSKKPPSFTHPEIAQALSEQEQKFIQEKSDLLYRFQSDRNDLIKEISALQEENQKYLETIIKHSKALAGSLTSPRQISERSLPPHPKPSAKLLTLRQLREVIEEIYISKSKYDERCAENKMPRETMEQHMYNYLNTKYGLKNLILDWTACIIHSVKKHSSKDNDVAVFGKILRNECDEEFRFVQVQVKETVADLVRMQVRRKFPLKNPAEVNGMADEKISSFLLEDEWKEIVKYMYNDDDSDSLINQILTAIKAKARRPRAASAKGKVSREEAILIREREKMLKNQVRCSDLTKVLLDFQLKGHEKFLSKFVQIFRKVDSDNDGIVDEEEFRELIALMDLGFSEEDVARILQIIDPHNNQQITFSEGVALFSTELIPVEGMAAMKKLSCE